MGLRYPALVALGMAGSAALGTFVGYELGYDNGSESARLDVPVATTTIPPEQIVGQLVVSEVTDGDTFKVLTSSGTATVRVLGINAPESRPNQGRPVQCYAKEATLEATRLLLGKTIELNIDGLGDTEDSNGRLLRTVDMDLGPGIDDFSQAMVRGGFAAAYRGYRSSDRQNLITLEQTARNAQRGLWGSCAIPVSAIPKNLSTEVTFPPARPINK